MIRVDLYVDPVCPFAWIAAQWLREVAGTRPDVDLHLRQMSLAILNEGRHDRPSEQSRGLDSAWRPVRVGAALADADGEGAVADWLQAFGTRFHRKRVRGRDRALREALEALGRPDLYPAADDSAWDAAVRRSHELAVASIGNDVGTPTVHIDGSAIFGPVLTSVPRGDDGLRLFDGVVALVGDRRFVELKRAPGEDIAVG